MNIKGVFLHMDGDAGIALGVLLAGLTIKFTGRNWLDPAVCFAVILFVGWETWGLMKNSVNLSQNAVPESVDIKKVSAYLQSVKAVKVVYDLHIWGMSTTQTALSVHLLMPEHKGDDAVLEKINQELNDKFRITHPTIQIVHRAYADAEQLDCLQNQPGE